MASTELLVVEQSRRDLHFVDFVVVGIFVGAIIVGAGAAVRDILPRRRPRLTRRGRKPAEPEIIAKAWRRFCQSAGMLIITMGMIVILFTVLAIVLSLSDHAGWIMVGASTALAAAVLGLSAFIIPNHYRRGGFDPVFRTIDRPAPAPTVTRDTERRLGTPRLESGDDLFAEAVPAPADESVEIPVSLVTAAGSDSIDDSVESSVESPAPNEIPDDDRLESAHIPTITREVEIEEVDPGSAPIHAASSNPVPDLTPLPDAPPFAHAMRPIEEPEPLQPTAYRPAPAPRDPAPAPFLTVTDPVLETPLIDPDEELPAWNAPPLPTPPAPRYVPPREREQMPAESTAGFESSLLADLDVPAESDAPVSGPFQSRLLNELTGDSAPTDEGAADVLLEEISLPTQSHPAGSRDASDSR